MNEDMEMTQDLDDGWDDDFAPEADDLEDDADDTTAEEDNGEPESEPEADQAEGETEGTDDETQPDEDGGKHEGDLTFELKHLGELKIVGKDEVVTLAQKGMDYDRVRGKLAEAEGLKPRLDEYETFLKEISGGRSIDDLIDETRATMLAEREGLDRTVALERIRLQKEKRILDEEKAKLTANQPADTEADEKQKSDFLSFARAYPNVDPKDIPRAVWEAYGRGVPLKDAYEAEQVRAENQRLATELENSKKEKKEKENRAKSTGSRKTAGNKTVGDPWLDDWDSSD